MKTSVLASATAMLVALAVVVLLQRPRDRVEGMHLRRPTEDEALRGLALTCASTSRGAKECGWLWERCVYGEEAAACDALGEAGRMARRRHGTAHPLSRVLD